MTRVRASRATLDKQALQHFDRSKFNNTIFEAGVLGKKRYPTGELVAVIAVYNEYGTDNAPARPALRTAIKVAGPALRAMAQRDMGLIVAGKKTLKNSAAALAKLMAGEMYKQVFEWDTPPNADSTIARKGFDNPLVETDLLLKSITFKASKAKTKSRR